MKPLFLLAAFLLATPLSLLVAAESYDPAKAWDALMYCKAGYCDSVGLPDWTCPTCLKHHTQFTSISVFKNASDDYLAFTGYNPEKNNIVVAMRGTNNLVNWIKNLEAFKTPYDNPACVGCQVHYGFYTTWKSIRAGVLSSTAALVEQYPNASEILITGHSLGATVAVFAGIDLAALYPTKKQYIYNFGEPRAGDPAFAAWTTTQLQGGRQFRVTHKEDPVPHLPPMSFGFLHLPHELWYDNDGNTTWKDCKDSASAEDPHCSDSVLPIVLRDHTEYLGHCTNCEVSKESDGHCPL